MKATFSSVVRLHDPELSDAQARAGATVRDARTGAGATSISSSPPDTPISARRRSPRGASPFSISPRAIVGPTCVRSAICVCIAGAASPAALSRTSGSSRRSIRSSGRTSSRTAKSASSSPPHEHGCAPPIRPLGPETMRLAIVLLYTTGMRRRELTRLTVGDYDSRQHTLMIRDSKFHKSRLIPVSTDAAREIDRLLDGAPSISDTPPGRTVRCSGIAIAAIVAAASAAAVRALFRQAAIRTAAGAVATHA